MKAIVNNNIFEVNTNNIEENFEILIQNNPQYKLDDFEIFLNKKEAEQLLNTEVEKILDEYDYDNIGDVKVYADDETSPFYEEAKKILEWYKSLWDWFYEFIDEKEEVDYKEFKANYPKFEG